MSMVYECIFMTMSVERDRDEPLDGSLTYFRPREEFEENFAEEFENAQIVVLGSARLGKKNIWGAGIVIAGADKRSVHTFLAHLDPLY